MKKQIKLSKVTILQLQKKADAEGRSLKNYMERILILHVYGSLNEKKK